MVPRPNGELEGQRGTRLFNALSKGLEAKAHVARLRRRLRQLLLEQLLLIIAFARHGCGRD